MLNTDRIRIMTKLNRYEQGNKKDYLKINEMYRSDYIGMSLLKNFFCVTTGYILLLGIGGLYHLDFLMATWFKLDLLRLFEILIGGYLITLAVYSLMVYVICTVRYAKMKQYVREYDAQLQNLEEQYAQNDRRENG